MNIIDRSPSDKACRRRIALFFAIDILYLTFLPRGFVVAGYGYLLDKPPSAYTFPEQAIIDLSLGVVAIPLALIVVQAGHYLFPISRSVEYPQLDDWEK